jgi:hypothetical protein
VSLLKLIGLGGVPAWVVEAIAIVALSGTVSLYLMHRGAARELAKLHTSSVKLQDKANKDIAQETAAHAADNAANQETLNATLKDYGVLSDTLDQRVRDFDAYRRSHPDVARPAGGSVPAGSGECGTEPCADLAVRLAERGDDLARSVGELAPALQACQRDRDSLNGLPK